MMKTIEITEEEYDTAADTIEAALESAYEYETQHPDSGDNYSCGMADRTACNNAEQRLSRFLSTHGVATKATPEEILESVLWFSRWEDRPGHIFCSGDVDYHGEGDYRGPQKYFQLDGTLVGEIETEFCLPDLARLLDCDEDRARAIASLAMDDRRFCLRDNGDGGFLAYDNTDCTWEHIVSIEELREIIEEIEESKEDVA